MDLHGQSEHQFLTEQEKQLAFLDQTGNEHHRDILAKTREACMKFMENHKAYAKLVRENQSREEKMRSLEHDLDELHKADVKAGEASALMKKRKALSEAEKKSEIIKNIRECFWGNDENESCLARIRHATEKMKILSSMDQKIQELSSHCESIYFEIEEIAYQISQIAEKNEYDPDETEKTDNRLDLIHRLERKFSTEADQIPSYLTEAEKEYEYLSDLENQIARMSSEHKKLLGEYRAAARELTESRQTIAADFEKKMMNELRDLGMGSTQFHVEFKANETGKPIMPSAEGDDRIEFLISSNPGEPLKPLARIASGGELSRMMLAVKTLESSHTGVESMVFDEIDTGISGRMAQVVAEKMIEISRHRQVICVTHLPQIAAAADYHYMVRKSVSDGRTNTMISELDTAGRTEEISRMISGADGLTSESRQYAAGMIQSALTSKKEKR